MSRRSIALAVLVSVAAVLVAGIVFAAVRDRNYESVATVVLSPSTEEPDRISSLLESFERSGTLGTYVELIASDDTTREAREREVDITVRAVPDTRAIRIIAVGEEEDVEPALRSVIASTEDRETALSSLFVLEVLENPSSPILAGPSTALLLLATVLLAILAGTAAAVILRRLAPLPVQDQRPSGRSTQAKPALRDR